MKRLILTAVLSCIILLVAAQTNYSRVKLFAGHDELLDLAARGLAIDHGIFKAGTYVICELSKAELAVAKAAGINYEILIDDVSKYYRERNEPFLSQLDEVKEMEYELSRDWPVPAGFELGPVGGFLTIDQAMEHLDSMASQHPDMISPRYTLDFPSHNGQELYWVRLSDNPTTNEDEPEVLYTGMHHAREAIGMQLLIYYMYYLLENYDTDPDVQYIVNNFELYFIPVVNMDGYAYNIQTDPYGGGMWRKNRRVNGDGSYGVDLNRNYGYMWGYDDVGSSPYTWNETYRGPSAFSEPEIQSVRNFCEEHEFRIALNYHSHANQLLYPWGYTEEPCPHNGNFSVHAAILTTENAYEYGAGSTTIYPTNGGSDDWMYGEQSTKGLIYSYTPEVGGSGDGFWPPVSRIIPLCQENMYQNYMAAFLSGPYATVKDLSPTIIEDYTGEFLFELQRLGLEDGATYTVSIEPLNDAIAFIGPAQEFSDLEVLETISGAFEYTLDENILSGTMIEYLLSVNNGLATFYDTIRKFYGTPVVIFEDDASGFENWTSSKWNITTAQYHSPGSSITDSPSGNYINNEYNTITLIEPIDLSNVAYASLDFWAKWEIEAGYDYVQVLISSDNGFSWIPVQGKYTHPGNSNQAQGEPVYDGTQNAWVKEDINLEHFLGGQIRISFLLDSDEGVTEDGFYWDDMTVTIVDIATGVKPQDFVSFQSSIIKINPNPASGKVTFICDPGYFEELTASLLIYDFTGKPVFETTLTPRKSEMILDVAEWPAGMYFYAVREKNNVVKSGKLIVK